jgi:deoxyribodipyrimidine photo-lyase
VKKKISIFWFRRDLRIEDNHGLLQALHGAWPVMPIFIFDPNILLKLNSKQDARVEFIFSALQNIQHKLIPHGSSLNVIHATPAEAYEQLADQYDIQAIYANHDYEKYAEVRDGSIQTWAQQKGIEFLTFKDQVIFEKDEVLSGQNTPYTVFTPYSRKWKEKLAQQPIQVYPSEEVLNYLPFASELPTFSFMLSEFKLTV